MRDLSGYKNSSVLLTAPQLNLDFFNRYLNLVAHRKLSTKMLRSLIIIAGVVALANAYGSGAPPAVCKDLTPQHGEDPQSGQSPYKISIDKSVIKPGDEVKVTLEGLNGEKFKGFLVQARVGETIVGSFKVGPNDSEVQTIDCPNGKKNAATHQNPEGKSKISITWEAPKDLQDVVVFKATFVKNGETYWVGQTSSSLTVRQ